MQLATGQKQKQNWAGRAYFEPGIAVFIGHTGDNAMHQHWAHQIVVGLDGNPVSLELEQGQLSADALWIDAGTAHCLSHSIVLCLYLDPGHALTTGLQCIRQDQDESAFMIDREVVLRWRNQLDQSPSPKTFTQFIISEYWSSPAPIDSRLEKILQRVQSDVLDGQSSTRIQMAHEVNLSPGRFSHWFTEQAGIPLRTYRKWLRLLYGLELARKLSLTEAALTAGFSDQAHFCRAVKEAFGVHPAMMQQILKAS